MGHIAYLTGSDYRELGQVDWASDDGNESSPVSVEEHKEANHERFWIYPERGHLWWTYS